jgi:hypothetical protein
LVVLGQLGLAGVAVGEVALVQKDGDWQLRRDGQPFFIKGGGGDGSKAWLARAGGNSFRTWGVGQDTPAKLKRARDNGLMVSLGFWLGHERHGFDYSDPQALARQKKKVREGVLKYRDHDQVLMWVLGNEMEGYERGDDPRIWKHVQDLAAMVKSLDPSRPIMTVVAEINKHKVAAIHKHCPDVQIIGINSYGGAASIPDRYRQVGGEKPYVITEFGPPGPWEIEMNAFDAPPELTSTQKAKIYRNVWQQAIAAERDALCLGGYAFTWGWKQEATTTWFGMFLPSGEKLAAVDVMQKAWTGAWPANRCPTIEPLSAKPGQTVAPGSRVTVPLQANDPDGDALSVEWQLHTEANEYVTGGDAQDRTQQWPNAIAASSNNQVILDMPTRPGVYRLYAFVRDGHNAAATANLPLRVQGKQQPGQASPTAQNEIHAPQPALPIKLIGEAVHNPPYAASGYMGGASGITMARKSIASSKAGPTALHVQYDGTDGWAGVVWQNPANDWGEKPGGYDLSTASKLTFWARGEKGGETVTFGLGVIGDDKPYPDTASIEKSMTLTDQWRQYTIDVTGNDLSRIKTGFMWVAEGSTSFYLDDVQYQ